MAVHLHLLPNGRVLSWGRFGDPQIWDPASGAFTPAPIATDIFCAGHAFLADGRLLVAGGHISDNHGLPAANLFDPAGDSWTPVPPMAHGRWYPTATTLGDGRVLVLAGQDQGGLDVAEPEIWNGSAWTALPGASRVIPFYPRTSWRRTDSCSTRGSCPSRPTSTPPAEARGRRWRTATMGGATTARR